MNLWLRLFRVLVAALLGRGRGLLDPSVLRFRVLPHDLDLNMHMNNVRYLSLMDLGRVDLIVRCGFWRIMAARRWQVVVGGSMVRFRRPLKPFQSFTLSSRMSGWDDRWFYIEHRIEESGAPACLTVVRAAVLAGGKVVAPATAVATLGGVTPPLPAPDWAARWSAAEDAALVRKEEPVSAPMGNCCPTSS